MALAFDPDTHTYRHDGVVMPSVTTVLGAAGFTDTRWFTDEHRQRGRDVHLACKLRDDGDLDPASISPIVWPYLEAYETFLSVMQPEWLYVEHQVVDPIWQYAGTLDRAGFIYGVRWVVDIKTGEVPPTVGLQTAAYRRCLPEPHSWRRAALRLMDDWRFRWLPLDDVDDEKVFLAALMVNRWKTTHLTPV